jgi:hypothetical protein
VLRISSEGESVVFGSSFFLLGRDSADRKGRVNRGTEGRAREGDRINEERKKK